MWFCSKIFLFLRLPKQNPGCTLKRLVWNRPDNFQIPTRAELAQGQIWAVNIMDPLQTSLPTIDRASLNVITGGPYQVKLANGYITSIQVNIKLLSLSLHYHILKSRRQKSETATLVMGTGRT